MKRLKGKGVTEGTAYLKKRQSERRGQQDQGQEVRGGVVARAAAGQTTLSSGYSAVGLHWWKVPGLQPSDRVLSPCSYAARVPVGLWQVLVTSNSQQA